MHKQKTPSSAKLHSLRPWACPRAQHRTEAESMTLTDHSHGALPPTDEKSTQMRGGTLRLSQRSKVYHGGHRLHDGTGAFAGSVSNKGFRGPATAQQVISCLINGRGSHQRSLTKLREDWSCCAADNATGDFAIKYLLKIASSRQGARIHANGRLAPCPIASTAADVPCELQHHKDMQEACVRNQNKHAP